MFSTSRSVCGGGGERLKTGRASSLLRKIGAHTQHPWLQESAGAKREEEGELRVPEVPRPAHHSLLSLSSPRSSPGAAQRRPESEGRGKTSHGFSTEGRHPPASAPRPDRGGPADPGICPGSLLRHTLGFRGREMPWYWAGAVMPRPSLKAGSSHPAQCVVASGES